MDNRPVIKICPAFADKVLEAAGALALILLWGMVVYAYLKVPDTVPIHFNGYGEPDGYGSRQTLFIMPVIGTLMYIVLTALSAHPHTFNYTVTITPENAERQYRIAIRMMRWLKLAVLVIFAVIDFSTYKVAVGEQDGLGIWFFAFVFGMLFIPMAFFIYKSISNK